MKRDIRFLVTNSCNYGCYFCHNEGITNGFVRHDLTVDDYVLLFNTFCELEQWNGVTMDHYWENIFLC